MMPMLARWCAVAFVLPIAIGCASLPPGEDSAATLSPAQSWYAAEKNYESVLKAAIGYKDDCVSRPAPLREQCMPIVIVLRDINRDANEVMAMADDALSVRDDETLADATDMLEDLRDVLRAEVLDQVARDAQQPDGD